MRKRRNDRRRFCQKTGKRRYADRKHGQFALRRFSLSDREVKPIRVYFCHLCRGWHLTSEEKLDIASDD